MANQKGVAAIDVCPFGSRCLCGLLKPGQRRQRQVLHLLLAGEGEKQAAAAIGIKPRTLEVYAKELHHRFDVHSRGELMALAAMRAKAAAPGPKKIRHNLHLTEAQRSDLQRLIAVNATDSRQSLRAQVLLKCDGANDDGQIASAFGITARTIQRIRRSFMEQMSRNPVKSTLTRPQ